MVEQEQPDISYYPRVTPLSLGNWGPTMESHMLMTLNSETGPT